MTHVTPDPDALSSELVLAMYLKSLKKEVHVVNAETVQERYRFLPCHGMIKTPPAHGKIDYDVAFVVDCGDLDRVGSVRKIIDPKKTIINIDHHITNDRFGHLNLVAPQASSTAEVLYELLTKLEFKLTRSMAILLYLGIMTDTGSFHYDNTAARTHEVVSHLMKFKFSVSEFYKKLYETVPLNDLKYFTRIVNKFDIAFDGRVILLDLRKSLIKKLSQEIDLRDKIFKYLRAVKGVEVIAILTEEQKKKTKINLRSQSPFDVAKLAAHFNGGGHKKASGCMIATDMKQAKVRLLAQIGKQIQ